MTNSISTLDSYFTGIISNIMTAEKQPLTALTQKRDGISVQKAVYSDLSGMISKLQSSVKALKSSDAMYSFSPGYKVNVTNVATGSTIVSASAGSQAVAGVYDLEVESLAKVQRISSARQDYINQQLSLNGSFIIGGAASSSATLVSTPNSTVSAVSNSAVASGQLALGTDDYFVETRKDASGNWQFRMVNNDGEAASLKKIGAADYTSDWQSIPTDGTPYDSGRGLTIQFGTSGFTAASRTSGAPHLTYAAQGATINVKTSSSLIDIASAINHATYASGNEVSASIVDNRLVLANKRGGENRKIEMSDVAGDPPTDQILSSLDIYKSNDYQHKLQNPSSAHFFVNGLEVYRSKNTGLTDVVLGVTINLAADAEAPVGSPNKTATLEVADDTTSQKTALQSFIDNFNSLQTYLSGKTATTKQADGTYTRGALSGDMTFRGLRLDLLRAFSTPIATSNSLKRLADIGISLDNSLKASISDSSKLETALKTDRNSLVSLLDSVMSSIDTKIGKFTGSSGYVTRASQSLDSQLTSTNSQIKAMNARLQRRQDSLYEQYGQLQSTLMTMSYTQQQLSAMYGTTNTSG